MPYKKNPKLGIKGGMLGMVVGIKIAARKFDNMQWRARRRKWEGHVTINSDNWMVIPAFRTIKAGYGLYLSKKGVKIINPSLHQN